MSKISTYEVVPVPKLSDKLIGTSVGGEIEDITYNFTLQELLEVFLPVIPANNLQGILDYGNTATQDINLFGTITTTNLEVTDTANLFITYLNEETHIVGSLFDSIDSIGTSGQVLTSTGDGVAWYTLPPIFTPTLQQVLVEGNVADIDIILDANIEALDVSVNTATINDELSINGSLKDNDASTGAAGQVLSSTVTGVEWTDLPVYSATSPLLFDVVTKVFSIQLANSTQGGYLSANDWITFDGKQNAGPYITALTGEASANGPGSASVILNNSAVINKVLTGLNVTGGSISSADSILIAFGKVQNQINGLLGGVQYQGVWNALTNNPILTSSVGVQGEYYVVNVAGTTNLNGITDWQIGDWAIFSGGSWQKVDNTDLVTSVNNQVGAVSLTTDNIPEGIINDYFTESRARASLSFVSGSGAYNNLTGVITIPTKVSELTNDGVFITLSSLSALSPLFYNNLTGQFSIQQATALVNGYLSAADWTIFNNKQNYLGGTGLVKSVAGTISYITDNSTDWNTAYENMIISAAVTGTLNKTLTLTQQDGGTITATWTDIDTGLTSVGVSMPSAFTVTNSPLTANGTIGITGAGTTLEYIDGTGALRTFPILTGYVPYTGATANVDLGTYGLISDYLKLNISPTDVPTTAGTMFWNDVDGTMNIILKGGNVTLQVGQELVSMVVNKSGIDLFESNYQVVRVRNQAEGGAQGQRLAVVLAQANSGVNHTSILGLVTENILANQEGFITSWGEVRNIDTTGDLQGQVWIDGSILWLSETVPGGLTIVKPQNHPIQMGTVIYAHETNGKIFVKIEEGVDELVELHDVEISGLANNQGLFYNSTTLLWENKSIATVLGYTPADAARTLTINGVGYDLTANRSWNVGTVTSVGLTMPAAFSVANSPIINSGTLAVEAIGTSTQYIRGDGQLANFPSTGAGGSSVYYYLNGSIPSTVVGYEQMANVAVIGAGTDFSLTGNGLIAQFLTDVGNPNRLEIPGGAWNFEMFFSMSSSGGTPQFYVELLKYNGTTFTSIASGSAVPETINGGTPTDLYLSSLAVPTTTLLLTDRLAVRVYIVNNSGGRTATLHTENGTLCQVITTFAGGISAINGLTSNNQYLSVGTLGTDFNISSVSETHTFNLPSASSVNRGALSNLDWITFNNKVSPSRQLTINGISYDLSADRSWSVGTVTSVAALIIGTSGTDVNSSVANGTTTPVITLNLPTASATNRGALNSADWSAFNIKVNNVTASSPLFSSGGVTPNITIQEASGSQNGYLSSIDWTTFNNKQVAGNYITSLTGEATASGPGAAAVTLNNASVTAKVLTGVNITGGTVLATDTMLTAFGKLQNQINGLIGGSIYQGTWNASTNTPTLTSSVGTKGHYYIVSVAGTTNLNGITDWFVGDWAIYDGTAWQQVDNTDAVTSVNGQTGAVSLTTDNIAEGATNQYFLNSRARAALTFAAGSGAYNSTTGLITIPTNNNQLTNGASYITLASLSGSAPIQYNNGTGAISITQSGTASNGFLSSTDWNTFNNKANSNGSNASGTWGISITGNSATATNAVYANSAGSISGFNNPTTAATPNTIAYRDANGDLSVRELNMSVVVQDITPSSLIGIFPTTNQAIKITASGSRNFLNVPTRTGGDASGTWGISITGNSATATNVTNLGTAFVTTGEQFTPTTLLGVYSNGYAYKFSLAGVQSWLGLGGYLPLAGGVMTGNIKYGTGTGEDWFIESNACYNGPWIRFRQNTAAAGFANRSGALGFIDGTCLRTTVLQWDDSAMQIYVPLTATSATFSGAATFSSSVRANDIFVQSGTTGGYVSLRSGGAAASGYMEIYSNNGTTRLGYIGYSTSNLLYTVENGASHTFQGGAATFSSSVTAAQFLASSSSNAAIITSTGTTGYGLVAVGSSGGARAIFLAGQSGISNGFTVEYTGTEMKYGFQSGKVGIYTVSPKTRLTLGDYVGARLPYINGTGTTFNENGITVTSSNTANASIGGGIDLTNNVRSVGAYSPVISFSSMTSGGIYNNSYAGIWGIYQYDDGNWAAGDIAFGTSSPYGIVEKMRLLSNGNFGIGYATPTEKLQINGNLIFYTGDGDKKIYFRSNGTLTDTNWAMGTYNSPTGASLVTAVATTIDVYGSGGDAYGFMVRNTLNNALFQIGGGSGAAVFAHTVVAGTHFSSPSFFNGLAYPYNTLFGSGADVTNTRIKAGSTAGYESYISMGSNIIRFGTGSVEKMYISNSFMDIYNPLYVYGNTTISAPNNTIGNSEGAQKKFVSIPLNGADYQHRYIILCKVPTFGAATVNCGFRGTIVMERVNGIGIDLHDDFDLTVSYNNEILFRQTSYQAFQTSLVQISYGGVQYLALYAYSAPGWSIAYIDAIQTNYGGWLDANTFVAVQSGSALHSAISYNSNPTVFKQQVTVNGPVIATSFFESSDSRIKQLIKNDYKAVGIDSVKAKLYIKDGKEEIGYYAQDIQGILPCAVNKNDAGFLSLSYTQVHTAKIAIIEDEVTILKKRVAELESKLN
jgi:hypothetical protein